MTKGECIAYMIEKELGRYSLIEYLEESKISEEDFEKFIVAGIKAVDGEVTKC